MKLLRFKVGESYVWIFVVFVLMVSLGSFLLYVAVGTAKHIVIAFPIYMLTMLIVQLRSGVALDVSGIARYQRGTRQFTILSLLEGIAILFMIVVTLVIFRTD
jgi:hypothetical protein